MRNASSLAKDSKKLVGKPPPLHVVSNMAATPQCNDPIEAPVLSYTPDITASSFEQGYYARSQGRPFSADRDEDWQAGWLEAQEDDGEA